MVSDFFIQPIGVAVSKTSIGWSLLLAADAPQQAERIPPEVRAILVMALVGLVLTGLMLMALTWLWGRRLRRLSRNRPPERPREQSDWDRKQPASPHGEPPPDEEEI